MAGKRETVSVAPAPPLPRRLPRGQQRKNRVIRVEDELWDAAGEKAAADGYALAEVVRHMLRHYVDAD